MSVTRRSFLHAAALSPLIGVGSRLLARRLLAAGLLTPESFKHAPSRIVLAGDAAASDTIHLVRTWDGDVCRSHLTNSGGKAAAIKEVLLFDVPHALPYAIAVVLLGTTLLVNAT